MAYLRGRVGHTGAPWARSWTLTGDRFTESGKPDKKLPYLRGRMGRTGASLGPGDAAAPAVGKIFPIPSRRTLGAPDAGRLRQVPVDRTRPSRPRRYARTRGYTERGGLSPPRVYGKGGLTPPLLVIGLAGVIVIVIGLIGVIGAMIVIVVDMGDRRGRPTHKVGGQAPENDEPRDNELNRVAHIGGAESARVEQVLHEDGFSHKQDAKGDRHHTHSILNHKNPLAELH